MMKTSCEEAGKFQITTERKLLIHLNPGIEMNTDTCEDGKERVFGSVTDSHLVKVIVIQNSGVDSFTAGTVLIDSDPMIRFIRQRSTVSR